MIKPDALWAFLKRTPDINLVGRVCCALGGHAISLSPAEQAIVDMIHQSEEWYDDSVEKRRKQKREWAAKHKGKSNSSNESKEDELDKLDGLDKLDTIHPSVRPSVHPSQTTITRSVTVAKNGTKNGERNGEFEKNVEMARTALSADVGVIYSGEFPFAVLAAAVTSDLHSSRRWSQLSKKVGEDRALDELFAFVRELQSGEEPENRAACLNARLAKMAK